MKIELNFYDKLDDGTLVSHPDGLYFRGLVPVENDVSAVISRCWARIAFCYADVPSNWATGNFQFYWGAGKSNQGNYGGEYGTEGVNDYVEIPKGARWCAVEGKRADKGVLVSANILPLAK